MAAPVAAKPAAASAVRVALEFVPVGAALIGLAANFVLRSVELSILSVILAGIGIALRLARSGQEPTSSRSAVRRYLAGSFLFIVGLALASAYGPALFFTALPGMYVMRTSEARARRRMGARPSGVDGSHP
jgi:hypothetical protein